MAESASTGGYSEEGANVMVTTTSGAQWNAVRKGRALVRAQRFQRMGHRPQHSMRKTAGLFNGPYHTVAGKTEQIMSAVLHWRCRSFVRVLASWINGQTKPHSPTSASRMSTAHTSTLCACTSYVARKRSQVPLRESLSPSSAYPRKTSRCGSTKHQKALEIHTLSVAFLSDTY